MLTPTRILFTLVAAACLAACTADLPDDGLDDEIGGKADDTRGSRVYPWAATDYPTFLSVSVRPPFRTGAPEPEDAPLVTRLQAWSDRMHAALVARHAAAGTPLLAPRPIMTVVPAREANAWVSSVPACLGGPVTFAGVPDTGAKANLVMLARDEVKARTRSFGGPPPSCTTATNWPAARARLETWLRGLGGSCKARIRTTGVEIYGTGCKLPAGITGAHAVAIYSTSPYVHFTSEMLALADDELAVVSVIAHELGHYYRSHAVTDLLAGQYNYWFEHEKPIAAGRPSRASDSDELAARLHRLMPFPQPRVPGQRLSYKLTPFLIDGMTALFAGKTGTGFACAEAARLLQGAWAGELRNFSALVRSGSAASYLEFEDALLSCAGAVQVTEPAVAVNQVSRDLLHAQASALGAIAEPLPAQGTLAEVLAALNARALPFDAEMDAFLEEMDDRDLGTYTAEQDADAFSVAMFAGIGLDPRLAVEGHLDFITGRAAMDPELFQIANRLTIEQCVDRYRAGWMTNGVLDVIPIGRDLHSLHHSGCYRLFAMDQEIVAAGLEAGPAPGPIPGPPWAELRAAARELSSSVGGGGPTGGLHRPATQGDGTLVLDGF